MKNEWQIISLTAANYSRYIEQMAEIERSAFAEAWSRTAYEQDICSNPNARYTAVVCGDELIAYANYWLIAEVGNINNVAVAAKRRGQGFGKLIMTALIRDCRQAGGKAMTLEVRESNLPAISLYQNSGFISHGIRPHYYEDNGENAVIMWLDLANNEVK